MTTRPKIAFQGEPGANSDEACRTHFPEYEPVPYAVFEDAFEAVKSGACELGMIPVENSIIGRQGDVHHLLPHSGLRIIGERFKPIHFQLMANPGVKLEDVKSVISMPFAAAQCRKVLRKLGVRIEPAGDTAGSAKLLSEHPDPAAAAIAPEASPADRADPAVVKAVVSLREREPRGRALYFTRSVLYGDGPIWKHVGVYAYRRAALERFCAAPPSPLERREKLEQLRALEMGLNIWASVVDETPISVDTPADLEAARAFARRQRP